VYKQQLVQSCVMFTRGLGSPDRTMCPEVDSASESKYQRFLLR